MNKQAPCHSHQWLGLLLLFSLFLARLIFTVTTWSDTYDEMNYLEAGIRFAKTGSLLHKHPPMEILLHGLFLKPLTFHTKENLLIAARATMIPFSLIGAWVVYLFSKRIFGSAAAISSVILYTFCPNILTHSSLITSDILVTVFGLLALFSTWRALHDGHWVWIVLSGLFLGCALLSKLSGMIFLALTPLYVAHWFFSEGGGREKKDCFKLAVKAVVFPLLLSFFVLHAGYGFGEVYRPGIHDKPESKMLRKMNEPLKYLPMPYLFIFALDSQQNVNEHGHPAFLLSQKAIEGWWYYFPVAFFLKTPASLHILLILALLFYPWTDKSKWVSAVYLLMPVLIFFLLMMFSNKNNAGLRYLLPIFPLLYIFAGSALTFSHRWLRIVCYGLISFYGLSSFLAHPHYLSYFTEWVGGSKNGYKYLADSNLDWGQDKKRILKFISQHSNLIVKPDGPRVGQILVNTNELQDVFRLRPKYEWLRLFQPTRQITPSWFFYDLKMEDFERALREHPGDPVAFYALGRVLMEQERWPEALSTFVKSEKMNGVHSESLLWAGIACYNLGNIPGARKFWKRCLEQDPMNLRAYEMLIRIENNPQRVAELKHRLHVAQSLIKYPKPPILEPRFYQDILEKNPDSALAHNNLGFCYWRERRFELAEEEFRLANKLDPNRLVPLINIVRVLADRGRYQQALDLLRLSREVRLRHNYYIIMEDEKIWLNDWLVAELPEGL